nr:amino acid adenylation domain-containing protein [Microcystis aeruginosa K13-05]
MNFEELPLSYAQQRLWFLDQLEPNSPFYNISLALHLAGNLQVDVLEKSLQEIIQRHESLRTNFATVEGNPVQVIKPESNWQLTLVNGKDSPKYREEQEIKKWLEIHSHQPFDLANDSLIRATLLKLSDTEHFLLICLHHIVSDGWSMGVFIEELTTLYNAYTKGLEPLLQELPIQYADFAIWQREYLRGEIRENQLNYWQKQLAAAPALLHLPTDYPRPLQQSFQGDRIKCNLSPELSQGLNKLSREKGVTLFMTLLTAFQTLLYRYTGQTDILVGTPIANRTRSELAGLIGFFVNTLVLRTDLAGNPSFSELLKQVRETATDAYDHQDLPFEMLVEALQPERNMSYTPLFQVMFGLDNEPINEIALEGIKATHQPLEFKTAKFDLSLSIQVKEAGLTAIWEYNTDLFDKSTIERLSGHFVNLLTGIIANPEQAISQLPLLTESETNQLLIEWNNTQVDYPEYKCIHQLFEEQVKRTPEAVAVVYSEQQLTYNELNCRANQLAHYLQSLGVKPEQLVGICLERSLDMIVGLLAILKAGGAYVPLDPEYPTERLLYILQDAQIRVLLTQKHLIAGLPKHQSEIVCLDTDWSFITQAQESNPCCEVQPENLAYAIYTSGSTGKPKGVMIQHSSVVNLAHGLHEAIYAHHQISPLRVSINASLAFDASVQQIIQLIYGHSLNIVPEKVRFDSHAMLSHLRQQKIDVLDCTPSQLRLLISVGLLESDNHPQSVLVGGEAIDESMWATLAKAENINFYNVYGPTECTVDSTICLITANLKPVIGRPIAELHIGGMGLARGYLNRPELTQEKFIPNPFEKDEVIPPTPLNKGGNEPSKLYKTGDLCRYLPDGKIEYLGRIDNQVKIRGFRIELGEIETVLSQHNAVKTAVVIAQEDETNQKRLVAYIIPKIEIISTPKEQNSLNVTELRQFL